MSDQTEELNDAEYLKDLANRLMHIPVIYGIDGYDIDRLGWIADATPQWQSIETAPKGYPALEESSEWFLAHISEKYKGPTSSDVYVIQRVFNVGFGPWGGCGDEYYKDDFFDKWMPLSNPLEATK